MKYYKRKIEGREMKYHNNLIPKKKPTSLIGPSKEMNCCFEFHREKNNLATLSRKRIHDPLYRFEKKSNKK